MIQSNIRKEEEGEKHKIVTSPQLKRKTKTEEEPELCETNNKAFTSQLKNGLLKIAEDNGEETNKPVGYYSVKYADEVNKLKQELGKFVPIGSTFKESWRKANAAMCQERSSKKPKI